MGRQNISRKAWQRAINALLWYPDSKSEYASLMEELGGATDGEDPTGNAAVRLVDSVRIRTLLQEIEAVERALADLQPEQAEVIRRRFWDARHFGRCRKPRQYDFLQDLGYSIDGMKKITRQTVLRVAWFLGEK